MKIPKKENDLVNSPKHYTQGKIEVIDFIEDQKFDYHIGNAIKYICRYNHKGNPIQDLQKAIWYLERKISLLISIPNTPILEEYIIYNTKTEAEQIEESMNSVIKTLKEEKIPMSATFENHTKETCKWGGCFKCDPEGHKL